MAVGGQGAPAPSKPKPPPRQPRPPRPTTSGADSPGPHNIPPAVADAPAASRPAGSPPSSPPPVQQRPITGKPVPALQGLGYFGSILDFERRVGVVRNTYQARFGLQPPAGVAFDIARSDVQDEHIPQLLDALPSSDAAARASAATRAAKADSPSDFFVTRPDGVMVINNPLLRKITAAVAPLSPHEIVESHLKAYPNVQMGMLPIPHLQGLFDAVDTLDKLTADGSVQITENGVTLPKFAQEAKIANTAPASQMSLPGPGFIPAEANPQRLAAARAREAVRTIRQAQTDLNTEMGTHLPITGFFNEDWTTALQNWMKTGSYFRRVTQFQAQDQGFGTNVAAYLHAWRSKQSAVRQHGLAAQFLNAMPVQLFGHGIAGTPEAIVAYLGAGFKHGDVVSGGLHALTRTSGLALDTVGGSVQQAKADAAAGHALAAFALPMAFDHPKTFDEAKADAKDALRANPSWLRIIDPTLPDHPHGRLAVLDQATNLVGDLILLRKPAFTGERIAAGDVVGASRSPYIKAAAHWAYQDLRRGQIGRAASRLESGPGSERLAAAAAKGVLNGSLSEDRFSQHVADLYTDGHTALPAAKGSRLVTGPTLMSLRTRHLPAPGVPGRAWINAKGGLRDSLDTFDRTVRQLPPGPFRLAMSGINNVATLFRKEVYHAAGKGARGYFDPRLPEAVYNYTLKTFGDPALANKLESGLVVARARNNVPAIQAIQRRLEAMYTEKFPKGRSGQPQDPFQAVLSTEAPTVFRFPSGGERNPLSAFDSLANRSARVNDALNSLAKLHARIILSGFPIPGGGFSLFWKHAVGDTLRRFAGGGLWGDLGKARKQIDALAAADPAVERQLGTYMARVTQGETRWMLDRNGVADRESFRTGDVFKSGRHMDAAGAKVRALITDPALTAYQQSYGSIDPLTQLVLHDRVYQGLWKAARKEAPDLAAEDYAALLHERFKDFEDAAHAAGVADPFGEATKVLTGARGMKADHALGEWIKNNKIDFDVQSGLVSTAGTFDNLTSRWVGNVIMRPNKWNRGKFGENVLHSTFADLVSHGWDPKVALETSMAVAEKQASYHMLDFANRLQIEQDLRWLSYFATKHRLYWKWVIGQTLRKPRFAALVTDVRNNLDDRGNIPFSAFGRQWLIPAARLVWVPGREYSEVSPLAGAGLALLKSGGNPTSAFNQAKGTYGNIFTRSDTAISLGGRLALMQAGKMPATYGTAVADLDTRTAARIRRALNDYQTTYFHDHHQYAPMPDAVKHVLAAQTAEELWRANLPFPVLPNDQAGRNREQTQLAAFMALDDPKARRDYLEKHPNVSDHFGIYQDPRIYLHNREMFGRYTAALDQYRAARAELYDQARKTGYTPELQLAKKKLDAGFQATYRTLVLEDAKNGGGQVDADGNVVKPGSWGRLLAADPFLDPRGDLSALFPNLKHNQSFKVYGTLQKHLQAELTMLSDPKYAATYPDPQELKTRRREILQQLDVFRRYPTDALGKLQATYIEAHVTPFWTESDKRYEAIKALPREKQDLAWAHYRAWRDEQDKPVTIDGVKFPSPLQMAWATLDPQTRRDRLAKLAASNWDHLADYEKQLLLGRPVKGHPSEAWAQLEQFYTDAKAKLQPGERVPNGYRLTLAKYINRYYHPGFLADYHTAQEPMYQRLKTMSVVVDSPHKQAWEQLLTTAAPYGQYLKSKDYSHAAVLDTWKRYVDSSLVPWVNGQPGFKRELSAYGPDFLYSLVSP